MNSEKLKDQNIQKFCSFTLTMNLDTQNRDITLPTNVHIVKAMVFPVVVYGCESWTIKKSWTPKNWCFWTVVLKKTLESPLEARRSNQSILKETNLKYSLEGLMLKLQYFGQIMWRANSLEKTVTLRKIEGRRRWGHRGWDDWMASSTQWTWVWANSWRQWRTGESGVL